MEAKKNDFVNKKLRWDLLPLKEIEKIVKVYTAGSEKYGENTWQNLPNGYDRYKSALFRHLLEYEKGNEIDEETGCEHLAQVAWNAIAMLHCAPKWETESFKENLMLCALNKRIEEKIDSTNKILDEMESLVSDKEKERRSQIIKDREAEKKEVEEEIEQLRKKLEYETNGIYTISKWYLYNTDKNIEVNITKWDPWGPESILDTEYSNFPQVSKTYRNHWDPDFRIADLKHLVNHLIKEYNEHNKRFSGTGDGSVQAEDPEISE